jgi:hypothetical protein
MRAHQIHIGEFMVPLSFLWVATDSRAIKPASFFALRVRP